MRNYLSFGGGVNSVAMMLLLLDEGVEFEAVYVWMPDHPSTHEYLLYLEYKGMEITTIFPSVKRIHMGRVFYNLYDFCYERRIFPYKTNRWCTKEFKVQSLEKYFQTPAFVNLGIDYGEKHRAQMAYKKGLENRYPLIEREISRPQCIEIIKSHGLDIPRKSGCFFCPLQSYAQWRRLRKEDPELFCKAMALEKRSIQRAREAGKAEHTINFHKSLTEIVDQGQRSLFPEIDYPPCQCGL